MNLGISVSILKKEPGSDVYRRKKSNSWPGGHRTTCETLPVINYKCLFIPGSQIVKSWNLIAVLILPTKFKLNLKLVLSDPGFYSHNTHFLLPFSKYYVVWSLGRTSDFCGPRLPCCQAHSSWPVNWENLRNVAFHAVLDNIVHLNFCMLTVDLIWNFMLNTHRSAASEKVVL